MKTNLNVRCIVWSKSTNQHEMARKVINFFIESIDRARKQNWISDVTRPAVSHEAAAYTKLINFVLAIPKRLMFNFEFFLARLPLSNIQVTCELSWITHMIFDLGCVFFCFSFSLARSFVTFRVSQTIFHHFPKIKRAMQKWKRLRDIFNLHNANALIMISKSFGA